MATSDLGCGFGGGGDSEVSAAAAASVTVQEYDTEVEGSEDEEGMSWGKEGEREVGEGEEETEEEEGEEESEEERAAREREEQKVIAKAERAARRKEIEASYILTWDLEDSHSASCNGANIDLSFGLLDADAKPVMTDRGVPWRYHSFIKV